MADNTIYVKMSSSVKLSSDEIRIADLGKIYCQNKELLNRIKPIRIHVFGPKDKGRCVIGALRVIQLIHESCPTATVDLVGETETIAQQVTGKPTPKWMAGLKIALVSGLCFLGTVYTIMAYHNEIDITTLFHQIHALVMGEEGDGFTILELSYSIGLSVGILLFYNHIGKRRLTPDPSPVEVEMRTYADEVNRSLVETANREEKTIDIS